MVNETPEGKEVVLEEKQLQICPLCSVNYGEWEVPTACDECGENLHAEKIICTGGFHYHPECFEERKKEEAAARRDKREQP
mgnify:CR=1 FL=1